MKKRKINKYSKLGILLIGILFTMSNCDKDHLTETSSKEKLFTPEPIAYEKLFQTVSIDESKEFFIKRKHEQALNRIVDPLELEPDLDGIHQEYFLQSDELITIIPAETKYPMIETNILQVKSFDGEIHSLLFNEIPDINSSSSNYFTGIISVTTLEGRFIEAYRLEEGIAISELSIPTTYSNQCYENLDPWSIFCFQQLPEIQITSTRTNFHTSTSYLSGSIANNYFFNYFNNSYYAYAEGYLKYLEYLKYLNDLNKPCAGDPIKNPSITSSGLSGKRGGTFGCTISDPSYSCDGVKGKKQHDGLDITALPNSSLYAMYGGVVIDVKNSFPPGKYVYGKYGNYRTVLSEINGQVVKLKYNHLNSISVYIGQSVSTGQIIGLTGTTGNVKGNVIPHVHIQTFNSNGVSINPIEFLATKFDSNYNTWLNPCK